METNTDFSTWTPGQDLCPVVVNTKAPRESCVEVEVLKLPEYVDAAISQLSQSSVFELNGYTHTHQGFARKVLGEQLRHVPHYAGSNGSRHTKLPLVHVSYDSRLEPRHGVII